MFTDLKFVSFSKPLSINVSDHFSTVLVYKKSCKEKNPTEINIRDMSEVNIREFKLALSNYDWSYIHDSSEDVNYLWDRLYIDVVQLLDKYCPYKTIRIKKTGQNISQII